MTQRVENKRLIQIGMDSMDHDLMTRWIGEGKLPTLERFFKQSVFSKAHGTPDPSLDKGHRGYTAEAPWTIFFTSCWPRTTGYWSPAKLNPDYTVDEVQAYNYDEFHSYYDYCRGKKIVAFDVPHVRVSDRVDGLQVMAWGAHSPQGPSESKPAPLLDEITARYGPHPTLHDDDLLVFETERKARELEQRLITGLERRTKIVIDMLREREWDLFLTVFGETHSAGHGFWHLSQSNHPLYEVYADKNYDPLLNVYQAMDKAVAEIMAAAPEDAYVMLYSNEGMKANSADLPSWLFLPELLYRYSFDGQAAMAKGTPGTPVPPLQKYQDKEWMRTLWELRETKDPLAKALQKKFRMRFSYLYDKHVARGKRMTHPLSVENFMYMPQMWYSSLWSDMKAFALPSFSEGYARINVKGREDAGIVEPEDFNKVRDEIIQMVSETRNARTGDPIVRDVIIPRAEAFDRMEDGPDADLIFLWNLKPMDTADNPVYGRIGPGPYRRTGDHHDLGFFALAGPGIVPQVIDDGYLVDVGPTVLDLLGVPMPNHFDGRSRLSEILEDAA
ncbi:MAG: alkaline phosphatase family protein [Pseudomonadota bacterium]